jgi:hypothetical protein
MNEQQFNKLLETLSQLAESHEKLAHSLTRISNDGIAVCPVGELELTGQIYAQARFAQDLIHVHLINNSNANESHPLEILLRQEWVPTHPLS